MKRHMMVFIANTPGEYDGFIPNRDYSSGIYTTMEKEAQCQTVD